MNDRQENRVRWGTAAAGWGAAADGMRRVTMPVSTWMVDAIRPQPGHTVLELAAGPGDTGFLAAELIRPGGTLISSDLTPEMLSVAQQRAEQLGLDNVRFRQIDLGQPIDVEAASIDGVLCRWGYMLLDDPESALRETRRILRRDGRLALAAWTGPDDNGWSSVPAHVVSERGLVEPVDPDAPGQFTWAEPGVIAEHLEAAGFVDYEVAHVDFVERFASVEDWWDTVSRLSGRISGAVAVMDAATRADVVAELDRRAAPWKQDDGSLAIPAKTWVAAATA